MKYYNLGSINNYKLTFENFHIFLNIIKQVIYSIILAYESKGFIHGDLHCGNILLKPKKIVN